MDSRGPQSAPNHSQSPPAPAGGRSAYNLSKITPPTLQRVHANQRLFDRLDAARQRRVTWVHGPPGAGKTTLVASYFAARGIVPVWYRLDGGDADPATVFFYLSKAVAQNAPGGTQAGAVKLPLLTPEFRAGLPLFTRRFFRDLFATPAASIVVFDDYHEVEAGAALHGCLPYGLEEVPEGCHVVIISRTPPSAQLARLRLNGIVDVVEPDVLRMSQEEASGLARERGVEASAACVAAITRQTQGWAAGVILMLEAGAAAIGAPDKAPVPEVLFDYFAGEILQRTDAPAQRLLCILALMPTMTASAAESLTGSVDAGPLLEDLRKRNYFTSRDSAPDPRYRFHPLFADFLLETARTRLSHTELTAFRVEAAAILDEEGQPGSAVALLAAAGALDKLADLVRRRAATLLEEGRNDTLIAWLARLPDAMIVREGWLSYWAGAARVHYAPATALPHHRRASALFEAADDVTGQYLAWAGEAESVRLDAFGDFARYDPLLDKLPKLMARHPDVPKGAVLVSMTMAVGLGRRSHDRAAITYWQERALREARESQRPGLTELMGYLFAITDMHDAKFAAARCALDALPDPRTLDDHPLAKMSGLIVHTLAILYRQAEGDCVAYVEDALAQSERMGFVLWLPLLTAMAANDARRRDDIPAQRAWLQRTATYADRISSHRGSHYHMTAAHFCLATGDLAAAMNHADKAVALSLGWRHYEALGRVARAEILVESAAFDEAAAELERLDRVLAESASASIAFSATLLRAELFLITGKRDEGARALAAAMGLGRKQDNRRTGLAPARGARLCGSALRLAIEPDYVRTLIRHSAIRAPDPYDEHWPWPIRITTLGGLAITRNDEPLVFARKTPKRLIALLKAIAAYGGRNVPEEKLVDAVWPDEEGDAGRSAMTTAIHRLRKLLGDNEAIIVSGGTVGLDPKRCWLDVWTVEHLIALDTAFDPQAGLAPRCERIFALYGGDFLAGDADAPWAAGRRDQLRRRFARMVAARAEGHEAQRRADEAIATYRRGLDVAPTAEDLAQRLMRIHLAAGHAAEGVAAFQRLRQALAEDGAAPTAPTEALFRKLLAL